MHIRRIALLALAISFFHSLAFSQGLVHNFDGKHIVTTGGYYSYSKPGRPGRWLFPFFAYQHNVRLDNKIFMDRNAILLQLGTSLSPSSRLDADASNYVLMQPGYVNPFATLYTTELLGRDSSITLSANISTGLKLLPFEPIAKGKILRSSFLQYYAGLGAGFGYKQLARLNVQYNWIFHDLTDHSREAFRTLNSERSFHGSFVAVNFRINLTPVELKHFSAFSEAEWRSLGKSYQMNKTISFGLGATYAF